MKAGRSRLNANSKVKHRKKRVDERSEENQIKIKNYGSECL